MKIDATWTAEDLMGEAVKTVEEVESGEVFIVSDLFRGFEWKRLPAKTRKELGRIFSSRMDGVDSPVIAEEKTQYNQQKYRKR